MTPALPSRPVDPPRERLLVGWDVGGAHLKAALLARTDSGTGTQLLAVQQLPCPLWHGLGALEQALAQALDTWLEAWPAARDADHAVTMTGELVDAFEHREAGVQAISDALQRAVGPGASMAVYAGAADNDTDTGSGTGTGVRWVAPAQAAAAWPAIASANWLATAQAVAGSIDEALLVDIGSTTTDLVAIRGGQVCSRSRSDLDRLASGELVYLGVVRTPLCSLGAQVPWQGRPVNVMNEFFATTADVYRLLGELDPTHDQHPPADGGEKTLPATRRRLARLIGLDARDAPDAHWAALAAHWREQQLATTQRNAGRVLQAAGLGAGAPLVLAGAGHRLGARLAARLGRPALRLDALWATPAAAHAMGNPIEAEADGGGEAARRDEAARRLAEDLVLAAPAVAVARLRARSL